MSLLKKVVSILGSLALCCNLLYVPAIAAEDGGQDNPFSYIAYEKFDKPLTDPQTQPMNVMDNWGANKGETEITDGKLTLKHVAGSLKGGYQMQMAIMPGYPNNETQPYSTLTGPGEICLAFDWSINSKITLFPIFICGSSSYTMKLEPMVDKNKVSIYTYNQSGGWTWLTDLSVSDLQSGKMNQTTILMDIADENAVVKAVRINEAVYEVPQDKQALINIKGGLKKLMFMPNESNNTADSGEVILEVDNLRAYQSAEYQLNQLLSSQAGEVAFDQIKGSNSDPQEVTQNLDLAPGKKTANGLEVLSWKISDSGRIKADGSVVRAQEDTQVTLTPVLGLKNLEAAPEEAEYASKDGKPITVTVKGAGTQEPVFGWKDAYLTQDGERVDTVHAGVFRPQFILCNTTQEAQTVTVITAVYQNSVLLDTVLETVTVPANQSDFQAGSRDIKIEEAENVQVRHFVWNNMTQIRPVEKLIQN